MKLVIATPVDGDATTGMVSIGYAIALAQLLRDNHGLEALPAQITYSHDIVRARNRLAAMVMRERPDVTHVLWWDGDVVPRDLSLIGGMLRTGQPVIGAPYLRKRVPSTWVHNGSADVTDEDRSRGWMPVSEVGFGFTITSTAALRAVASRAQSYLDVTVDTAHEVRDMFGLVYHQDRLLSEDFSFCHRYRAQGGRIALYLGPGSLLSHVGQYAYTPGART